MRPGSEVTALTFSRSIVFDLNPNNPFSDNFNPHDEQKLFPKDDFDLYQEFLINIKPVSDVINPIRCISWEAAELYQNC